jgi:hypothetical protein
LILLIEGVGDVLEKDEAEDDVLVLGSVHVVAQFVSRCPQRRFETEVGAIIILVFGYSPTCGLMDVWL